MRNRIWQVSTALFFALAALLVFGTFASQAAPSEHVAATDDSTTLSAIQARRIISIPFGIDDTLRLSEDGQIVHVTGHAECPPEGETYRIQVTVTQDDTRARARGRTAASCADTSWAAAANQQGPNSFTPGPAEVCAKALIHTNEGGAITFRWCKAVTLQE